MEGWFYVVAALLVGAGFGKVRDPAPTQGALAAASLPATRPAAVSLGAIEIAAGVFGILAGGLVAALAVAAIYAGFTGFVAFAMVRKLPLQSCGCFGREDTPPSLYHVVIDLLAAAGAVAYGFGAAPSLPNVVADQPLWGVPYMAFVVIGVYTLYLILAELPRLDAIARRPA
jgi:hypothetical protein